MTSTKMTLEQVRDWHRALAGENAARRALCSPDGARWELWNDEFNKHSAIADAIEAHIAPREVTIPGMPYTAQEVLELRNRLDDRLRNDEYAIALAVSMLDYLRDILLLKPSAPRVVTDMLPPGWRVNEDTSTGFIEICNPKGEYVHIGYLPQGSALASRLLRELAVACINSTSESFANSLPAAIPPGYVVVPVEPTEEMLEQACTHDTTPRNAEKDQWNRDTWSFMLAAAPQE